MKISSIRKTRALRVRKNMHGTAERPRLCVTRSAKQIYAQLIDDDAGKTFCMASSLAAAKEGKSPVEVAKEVGKQLAEKAAGLSIKEVVFDRGMRKFHGRLKSLADAAREAGLQF